MKPIDVTNRVLAVLESGGPQSLEDLLRELPDLNWVQLSLALDKLLRASDIAVWRTECGDYRVIAQTHVSR
jgi:mRNA-degrading endonuclease RelE of RelBE toxin-antitoxin system